MVERNAQVPVQVPFFRPSISNMAIDEVMECLHSGWLTTGPRTRQFEADFAAQVGAKYALALNSCTAALHLAVEGLGLRPGQAVLVPTMTFAATAEVVRYQGAVPLLVDCDPETLNIDLDDAERKIFQLKSGQLPLDDSLDVVGIIPVHVGGSMVDVDAIDAFAAEQKLWVVEDAAHAFPAAYRSAPGRPWRRCGEKTAAATCYSFYANKTITTGEGGMVVTDDADLAERMKAMSLHGLSHDAWKRFDGNHNGWDYQIVAPGFKYNMTDIAAAIGIHQLRRAEEMRQQREAVAAQYFQQLGDVEEIELPEDPPNRIHSWHLFPIRLNLDRLGVDRNAMLAALRDNGVGCSVHWRPLHLHPYYRETFSWKAADLPVATVQWQRLISLPIFPGMTSEELTHVGQVVRGLCREHAVRGTQDDCTAVPNVERE